ncbi:MAG TPA: helix-turn-helix transcriptional regulator [Candidatus Acidoferrales bacterium]|nr:helix-turn-helix transcriptional regulator [Candidatus Acidoferrales bacterium]
MGFFFKHGHEGFEARFGPGMGRGRHRGRGGWGPGGGWGARGRGDLKYEILEALLDGPRHGYDIMLTIEQKRGLRPSPGSIYPALQMLEDGDYVRGQERDGKRVYEITGKGRDLYSQRGEADGEEMPWSDPAFYATIADAMRQVHGIKDAAKRIAKSGNLELYKKAVEVLDRARRELLDILADHV